VVCSRLGETLGQLAQPSGTDAYESRSPSLEVWLRSHAYSLTNLPGEIPKSSKLGDVNVLHAVSSLKASPGERGVRCAELKASALACAIAPGSFLASLRRSKGGSGLAGMVCSFA
jgi:hypothetical protein